ncbi:hypothetical protein GC176_19270 [bacterium]|nr:hypothetical protein [bacterium]
MMYPGKSISFLMLIAFLAVLPGCGGSSLPPGATGTVRGKVTYNGEPVPEGCAVVFMRDDDGLMGIGAVGANGEYLLRMRDGLKIVVGVYRVCVTPPNPAANLDQDEIMKLGQEGKLPDPATVKEVPTKYRSPEESNLIYDVQPGSNTFDIDMKD